MRLPKKGDFVKFNKLAEEHFFNAGAYSGLDYEDIHEVVYVYESNVGIRVRCSYREGYGTPVNLPIKGESRFVARGHYVMEKPPINYIKEIRI